MVATSLVFAVQDGISKHLVGEYNVMMVVMVRYWMFAVFVIALFHARHGSVRVVAQTRQPFLQVFRGFLLAAQICVMMSAIVRLGLVEAHSLFAFYPLFVVALAGPVLGEKAGWRRWTAVAIGLSGVLVILQPEIRVASPVALLGFISALMFALYSLLTRYAARKDTADTSFFWLGVAGGAWMTMSGIWFWEPMSSVDWMLMFTLGITGLSGHFLLIKCYEVSEASVVQPFAYLHLVFASAIGLIVFGESLKVNVVVGCTMIVLAGLFTLLRQRQLSRNLSRVQDPP